LLGALIYFIQAIIFAHTNISGLDEGSYLYKGYLFVTGVYKPFEPYGPLTNKAPLAFLIPGMAEFIFGPGLRTGRYFAIFLGLLTLLGTWITARRFGGKWLAAGAVWAFVLSPIIINVQAIAASEVIIACMLAWMCALVLGEDRPAWQIILGAILAALTILTRQNMVVVLPLLVLYVFWQHGIRMGLWSMLAGGLVLLIGHLVYWPNILTIWAPWLPENLTPFLNPYRLPEDAIPIWDPSIDLGNRVIAFFLGIRHHIIPVVGAFTALVLWSRPREWKSSSPMRAGVFLAVLYMLLFAMHAWAAVASQYESYSCVFCLTAYLAFFDPLGILLAVVAIAGSWNRNPSMVLKITAVFLVLVFSAGIGLSAFENVDRPLLDFPIPRMREGRILAGTTPLVVFLSNKFALSLVLIKKYLAFSLGLLAGVLVLLLSFWLWRRSRRIGYKSDFSFVMLNVFLALSFLFSPFLNTGGDLTDCAQDVIVSNEEVGRYLSQVIPPDSLVYWDGGLSFTPLTYVSDIRIFPPQINDGYTYRNGGDPDLLYRFSHWNNELNEEWKAQADVFIIEEKRYSGWRDYLNTQEFEEYQRPPVSLSCEDGTGLRIFHRLP
jgi:hypothetical protein